MRYRNLAASTQRIYTSAVVVFADFLAADRPGTAPEAVARRDVEAFVRRPWPPGLTHADCYLCGGN